ncbi:MAG: aminotransferase class I/II-fold pyridoxal phosphate-dependent enzyme [Thermoleophilia bacterium]|nr:aminotransferase class I/II-fold pyridoxal phosphate-dependent enzyme [Thermoleophilia bacterium]
MSGWAEHGGDVTTLAALAGLPASDIVDFSANINPLGPPAWLEKVVAEHLSEVAHYPDPLCREFVRAVCERHSVLPEEVLAGNGSTELLHLLPRALPVRRALIPVPSFTEYERAARLARLPVERILLREDQGFAADFDLLDRQLQPGDLLVVGQPN